MFFLIPKTILLSGGFDPLHSGHIAMMRDAYTYGEDGCNVIIALNSDAWLMRKKGYIFQPFDERKMILENNRWVDKVIAVDDTDGTVCQAIKILKPDYFGNGGDRTDKNTPEKQLCEELGIELVWNLGGGKTQSSSELVNKVRK